MRSDEEWEAEIAEYDEWNRERERQEKAVDAQIKKERGFLYTLAKEAFASSKPDLRRRQIAEVMRRYENPAGVEEGGTSPTPWDNGRPSALLFVPLDMCVWCRIRPPRGKQMLCAACNVYRRKYGRCPPGEAVDKRRQRVIEAEFG